MPSCEAYLGNNPLILDFKRRRVFLFEMEHVPKA